MLECFWAIFEFLITIFESFLVIYFMCSFLGHNFTSVKGKIVYVCGSIITAILVIIINDFIHFEGFIGSLYSVYFFIFVLFFQKGNFIRKIFISILTNVCLISVSALVSSILSSIFKHNIEDIYKERTLSRFLLLLIVQALLIYLFGIILKIFKKNDVSLKSKEWILIASVFVLSFISYAFIHIVQLSMEITYIKYEYLLFSELGLILINIVCFYMIVALSKSNKEADAYQKFKQQQELRIQYAENVKKQYEEMRRLKHDMKQNYSVIQTLQQEGKYREAEIFAAKCSNQLDAIEILIDVNNDFINAILNSKLSIANERGIQIIYGIVEEISGFDDIDICSLLGNILDNAIDACDKCDLNNKFIEIRTSTEPNKVIINVSNTINESVLKTNKNLKSSKKREGHGFGIKTINTVTEKYKGHVQFFEENNIFTTQVVLYR